MPIKVEINGFIYAYYGTYTRDISYYFSSTEIASSNFILMGPCTIKEEFQESISPFEMKEKLLLDREQEIKNSLYKIQEEIRNLKCLPHEDFQSQQEHAGMAPTEKGEDGTPF